MSRRILVTRALTLTVVLLSSVAALGQSQFQVLYGFTNGTDGGGLWGSVVFDRQGNIYGTTSGGGAYGHGTAFELSPGSGGLWTETVLHSFNPSPHEAGLPTSNLVFDSVGNLYGTAPFGGKFDLGDVFELTPSSGGWTESVIYAFGTNKIDGAFPYAGLTIDKQGNLYGTTPSTGAVYELTPGASGWTETILHVFCSLPSCKDGSRPNAGVIMGPSGSLYGVTEGGGAFDAGTVFQLRNTSAGWQENQPHSFLSFPNDGAGGVLGDMTMDAAGNLYGATIGGGGTGSLCTGGCGTVYKLTPNSNGHWNETILYRLQGGTQGFRPTTGVVIDRIGNIYGTTIAGGDNICGCGVVYKLSPNSNGTWTYSVLHTFVATDGNQPDANLVLYKGNLYGTTAAGGPGGAGVVFEITP